MQRFISAVILAAAILPVAAGCNIEPSINAGMQSAAQIDSGEVLSLQVLNGPADQDAEVVLDVANEAPGSRVKVYDRLIVIIEPSGEKTAIPHGWYRDLRFR